MSTYAQASTVTDDYFGVVLKSSTIPPLMNGNRDWSSVDAIVETSGAKVIRYPGGTEAWRDFDFYNPDHVAEMQAVIDYCESRGLKLNFTVSLRQFFNDSTSDEDGKLEMTKEDRAALSRFIENDLLDYAQDRSVVISQIQLDNEPLHRDENGEFLNFREYSKIASVYALLIGEIIDAHDQNPELIVITAGMEGTMNANGLSVDAWGIRAIISGLTESGAVKYIDGVDLHWSDVTLHPEYEDILGLDSDLDDFSHRSLLDDLQWQKEKWRENIIAMGANRDNLSFNVSAWSLPQSSDGGASLQNSGLSVMHLHSYSMAGISSATAYTLIGADANALFSLGGRERPGGTIFGMLSDSIVGLKAVGFSESNLRNVTATSNYVAQGFSDDEKMVIYLINRESTQNSLTLDLWDLIRDFGYFDGGIASIVAEILGLQDGFHYSDPYAKSEVTELATPPPLHAHQNFKFTLDPFEIAELTIYANVFSPNKYEIEDDLAGSGGQQTDTGRTFDNPAGFVNGSGSGDVFEFTGSSANVSGMGGVDKLVFSEATSSIKLSSREEVISYGTGKVTYKDIEVFVGSQFGDTFHIDSKGSFYGGAGEDVFVVLSSDSQVVDGGADDDTFFFYAAGDINAYANGGDGNDKFYVASGSVEIEGGRGDDAVYISTDKASFIYNRGDGNDFISLASNSHLKLKFIGIDEDSIEFSSYESGTKIIIDGSDEILFAGVNNLSDRVTLDFIF